MEKNTHNIELEDRKKLVLNGVSDVVSFDDLSVILDTVRGRLNINGANLHIHTLCLETGDVSIEGDIDEIIYEDMTQGKKKGLFGRIIR
ncbi:MAG: sporulation protein YabP [Ruminococcaceae bacterium]|nr:sporulation protein YabP [Oscillospiraceae bacterium]